MAHSKNVGIEGSKVPFNREFLKPLIMTVILIFIYRLGNLIPIPFQNTEGLAHGLIGISVKSNPFGETLSIFLLGIIPFASAYVLVEIFSLFTPYLKNLRKDYFGRKKLKHIALCLALVLAIFQANGIVDDLSHWNLSNNEPVLNISGEGKRILLISILVGSFYGLLFLSELISKFGIGNGISLIIISGLCSDFIHRVPHYWQNLDFIGIFSYILAAVILFGMFALTLILLRTKVTITCTQEKNKSTGEFFELNACPSSTEPLIYATSIIMLPVTFAHFFNYESAFFADFRPDSYSYNFVLILLIFLISYLFCWAFLHPSKRVKTLRSRGWLLKNISENNNFLLKKQLIYNLPWTVFLCLLAIVPSIVISGTNMPFYLGGTSIPIVVAVSLDLYDRITFSMNNVQKLVKIAEFHDIYDANMIKNHLKSQQIECYLQGYHHRLLLYFFGPYIDISMLVSIAHKEKAKKIIQDYYGGIGLTT